MRIEPGLIWVGWLTLVVIVLYIGVCFRVAAARSRYGVAAPTMTGHPGFERAVRVQANTLEHLVPFLVALWLCAIFWEPLWATVLGIIWLFGRIVYALGYYSAAERRHPGFVIAMIALVLLLIGTAYGLFRMGLVMGV